MTDREKYLVESWKNEVDPKSYIRNTEWRAGLDASEAAFVDRLDWMNRMWGEETNDPDSEWWRETLNETETAIVQDWDGYFEPRYAQLCKDVIDAARASEIPAEI